MRALLRLAGGALCLFAATAHAQQPPAAAAPLSLSIEEALELAERTSEVVAAARAQVIRAEAQTIQARSEWLPQLNGVLAYDRTLASEFEGIFEVPDTGGGQAGGGAETGFAELPFGQANSWRASVVFTQNLFSGYRTLGRMRLASATEKIAELGLASARASVVLDTAQAYYDAVLASRLLAISEVALQQAEQTLAQIKLGSQQGTRPEFDLLRAQVSLENQRPAVLRARIQRDLAHLRLKQLLDIPLKQPLELTSHLHDEDLADLTAPSRELAGIKGDEAQPRIAVQRALAAVDAREAGIRITASQHFPQLSFISNYGWVAYPGELLPLTDDWRNNWTVGLQLQVPLFSGLRISGEVRAAEANLIEARAQAQLASEQSQLDSANAYDQLDAARSLWEASAGTVSQAERAYQIAELRYREGISTQLELTDARLLLEQAQANRVRAARDLQVARVRVALLPYLPLGGLGTSALESGTAGSPTALGGGSTVEQTQIAPVGTPQQGGAGGGQ